MAGLDKITGQIKAQAQAAADETLREAREQAEKLVLEAREQTERECAAIEKKSQAAVAAILERGRSAAELKRRQSLLACKQAMIAQVLEDARKELKNMPGEAYFENIIKLAVKEARGGEGLMLLSEKDKKRLPAGFEGDLNKALKEKGRPGASLKVSPETRDIDSGFVLTYGGIEENCSFDAIFDAAHERLQDKVMEILFGTV